MHDIKCERFVISCGPLIQIIHTYALSHTYFSCFWARRSSALFIGECLLAFWLKLERESRFVGAKLTTFRYFFFQSFTLWENNPVFR